MVSIVPGTTVFLMSTALHHLPHHTQTHSPATRKFTEEETKNHFHPRGHMDQCNNNNCI